MKCCIIIPVYKLHPSRTDLLSIEQSIAVFHPHREMYYLCPEGMDLSAYPELGVIEAPAAFFESRVSYSRLCCRPELYELLAAYDYILLCQHDVWVFRDELDEFMALDCDYIGAPIVRCRGFSKERPLIGNGGLSLRRIQAHIEVCREHGPIRMEYDPEDVFFCLRRRMLLRVPPMEVAMRFSLEWAPDYYTGMMGGRLPMGCHRPWDLGFYDSFWKKYIPI